MVAYEFYCRDGTGKVHLLGYSQKEGKIHKE
jgi:hypothetical protein